MRLNPKRGNLRRSCSIEFREVLRFQVSPGTSPAPLICGSIPLGCGHGVGKNIWVGIVAEPPDGSTATRSRGAQETEGLELGVGTADSAPTRHVWRGFATFESRLTQVRRGSGAIGFSRFLCTWINVARRRRPELRYAPPGPGLFRGLGSRRQWVEQRRECWKRPRMRGRAQRMPLLQDARCAWSDRRDQRAPATAQG